MDQSDVKAWLKNVPFLVETKQRVEGTAGSTRHDVLTSFSAFIPNSAGKYKERAALTIQAINQAFPALQSLADSLNVKPLQVEDIATLSSDEEVADAATRLKVLLDKYGSDKANLHNYHHLYGLALRDSTGVKNILEIGLGTNNTDVVSNMGREGKPGASLRAFRDFCPNALVFGADIDERILFEEDRIQTFYVDQTDPKSFDVLLDNLPGDFDLIIDDGLHSPHANITSLEFGLKKVKKNGWVVIEDIYRDAISIWQVVAALLPKETYESHLFDAEGGLVFAVKRLK